MKIESSFDSEISCPDIVTVTVWGGRCQGQWGLDTLPHYPVPVDNVILPKT